MSWQHYRYLLSGFRTPLDFHLQVDELRDFDQRFRIILRRHLSILGVWALLNTLMGVVAFFLFIGVPYYFWMMNMVWGIINFLITLFITDHAIFRKFRKGDSFERFEVQRHAEKFMLLNVGLDIAYVFIGLLLREHAFHCGQVLTNLWLGFGWSVILQGGFLLIQDIWVLRLHAKNFRLATPYLHQVIRGQTQDEMYVMDEED